MEKIYIHIRKQDVNELFSDLWPLCSVGISMHVLECWLEMYAENSPTGAARDPTFRRKMRLKMLWICCMLSTVELGRVITAGLESFSVFSFC